MTMHQLPSRPFESLRVLCIEDEDFARDALTRYLRRNGAQVASAATGIEALVAFSSHLPQLVISDIRLPDMDGLELCRQMRAADPDVAIIFLSAHNDTDYLHAAIECGAFRYLLKPLDINALRSAILTVKDAIAKRQRLSERLKLTNSLLDHQRYDKERVRAFVTGCVDCVGEKIPPGVRHVQVAQADISGDFFCIQRHGDTTYALMADATGHGLSAILPALPVPGLFHELALKGHSLLAIADEINTRLRARHFDGHFVSATLVRLNWKEGFVEVVNCGNPPAILLSKENGLLREFSSESLSLGVVDTDSFDISVDRYEGQEAARLFLFSDGLFDSLNAAHEHWDNAYLKDLILSRPADHLFDELASMTTEAGRLGRIRDDITLIEIEFDDAVESATTATATVHPADAALAVNTEVASDGTVMPATQLRECTVLLIEDDPDANRYLSRFLGRRVAMVHAAETGADALRLFVEHRPRIVIADLLLPDMDGMAVVERIRAIDASVPIIIMSGSLPSPKLASAIDLKVAKFLPKPVDVSKLLDSISHSVQEFDAHLGKQLSTSVFMASSLAITVTNRKREIVAVNPAFTRLTGYLREEVIGRNPKILSSGKHDATFYRNMWQTLDDKGRWAGEIWNRRKNGELFLEWLTINAVKNAQGEISQYVSVFADVTERSAAEEKMRHLAHFDSITGLPNRLLFGDRIKTALLLAQRHEQQLAVMLLDVDHFKSINDTLGHSAGDELLRDIAGILSKCVRESDTVARFGGDEFAILLPDVGSAEFVRRIAGKIVGCVAEAQELAAKQLRLGVSVGVSIFPDDGVDAETLIKHADTAMYVAKKGGRNGYRLFSHQDEAEAQRSLVMQHGMREGLRNGEMSMHYQPKYSLALRRIVGAEALIRWHSATLGNVSPAEFIPIAEETGIIVEIGEWVIDTVSRQIAEWKQRGMPVVPVAINISPLHFQRGHVLSKLQEAMMRFEIEASDMQIELTEGVVMNDSAETMASLQDLRDFGIKTSIDDFGTGYSSLRYLCQLPINEIKIDRSFVMELGDPDKRGRDGAVPLAIIQMANSLSLDLVAEGVETAEQCEFLFANGCDVIQGYYFSKPVTPGVFFDMLCAQQAMTDGSR